jgi:hypothetical protein
MPKIKLGARPKTFKPVTLKFEMPDGAEGAMEVTYLYRTRDEYAQFITEVGKPSEFDPKDETPIMERIVKLAIAGDVLHLMQSVDAWNLDVELSEENMRQLANELPAAVRAMAKGYEEACLHGRLGN